MSRLIVIVIGMVLLWALFEFGASTRAPVIQRDIQDRTSMAMTGAGLANVAVAADGRDVYLSGEVSDEQDVSRAGDIAANVRGVRVVNNNLEVANPYITSFCKDSEEITLSGAVSDNDASEAFPERARDMFRYWRIDSDLKVRDDAPSGYRRFMEQALIDLGQLDEGCITLTDRDLLIKGSIRSERAALGVKERLDALADLGFTPRYELTLPVLSDEAIHCQQEFNQRVGAHETVLFSFDSDVIHEIGRQLLDEVVEIGENCPDVGVRIEGHTDSVGDKDYNIELSKRRADSVVAYLVQKGVSPGRMSAVGMGFSQPTADNSTEEGRAQNRRIEFRIRED